MISASVPSTTALARPRSKPMYGPVSPRFGVSSDDDRFNPDAWLAKLRAGSDTDQGPQIPTLKVSTYKGVRSGCRHPDSKPLPLCQKALNPHKGIYLDRWPSYAVAPLDVPLQTSGMFNCLAFMVVGPEKHYMLHLSPRCKIQDIQDNLKEVIDWPLAQSRLVIVPGMDDPTAHTIYELLRALYAIDPALLKKVEYAHYPDETIRLAQDCDGSYFRDAVLDEVSVVSYRGEVMYLPMHCTRGGQPLRPHIRPFRD